MGTRSIHYGPGKELMIWMLLFADDGFMAIRVDIFRKVLRIILALMAVFNFPLKWTKFKGGRSIQWIGYWIDLETYSVGISLSRRD